MRFPIRYSLLLLLLAIAPVGSARSEDDKPAVPDQVLIQGLWRVIGAKDEGQDKPKAIGQADLFDTAKLHVVSPNGRRTVYRYELDPTAKPKRMILSTDDELITVTAIYDLDGDTLKICYSFEPGVVPQDFTTKLNDGLTSLLLKRDRGR